MPQMIYDSTQLVDALVDVSNSQISKSIASSMIQNAYNTAGIEGVKQLASENGLNYVVNVAGQPEWFTYGAIEGATETSAKIMYREALDASIDSVTDDVVFETAKQVANKSGSKVFNAGALKTATSVLNLVGAVATGVDLGWKSYKEHPAFWTDLSNAVFNLSDPNAPIEVLARASSGGYTTAVKEKEICAILQGLADTGAFDYSEYESAIEEGTPVGMMDVTWTDVTPSGTVEGLAYAKAKDIMPTGTVVQSASDYDMPSWNEVSASCKIVDTSKLPSRIEVFKSTFSGKELYYATLGLNEGDIRSIGATLHTTDESVDYTNTALSSTLVISGSYTQENGVEVTGGLSVNKIMVYADNELFPNNHSASNISIKPNTPIEDITRILRDKFTDWYNDSWVQPEYNPETGEIENNRYYPLTTPWWNSSEDTERPPSYDKDEAQKGKVYEEPDTRTQPQGKENTKGNEQIETDPQTAPDLPIVTPTDTPQDPQGGTGTGASGLWAVYNPTIQELDDLGAYLWTNSIVELLEKFLQNPMDAIISLHKVYCTPITGNRKNIILGYLDSGVDAKTVSNQFKTIDCGTVNVEEYFEDARDYDTPYTTVECYLPFVGIVKLKTQDIIGSKVNIVYTIDVYSGACICKIFVTKLGAKQQLYCFSGNCSMQIPLTGADRTRMLSGAITGAVTGAFAGAQVGAVVGAVAGAFMGGTSIDRTSQFSANAGCMGIKKPYLIITRKYSYDAGSYNEFYGFPSNVTVSLSSCKGYTKIKSVHIQNMLRATDNEKLEIETLLKEGVIIN